MDFVSVRDFRTQPGEVWKKLAQQHELVVTRNGKPFAILTETSPTSLYADLDSRHTALDYNAVSDGGPTRPHLDLDSLQGASFDKILAAAWTISEQAGTSGMSMEEIIAEIEAARRALCGVRFGRAVDAIRNRAREQHLDSMTPDEIDAVIREVREERRHEAGN